MKHKFWLYLQLLRWDRPCGFYLLLWPTLSALFLAANGWPTIQLIAVFVVGSFLMRSAGCAINDFADREFDRHVKRTAKRPLALGLIKPSEALYLAGALALMAFVLVCTTNVQTITWSIGALLATLIYPYSKRFFAMPQAVLGIAFGFGVPMAFAAAQGHVGFTAFFCWLATMFWVLAYDTQYAMVDRDDDLRIGIRTSAITLGQWDVFGVMIFYALSLGSWSFVGWIANLHWPYFIGLLIATILSCRCLYKISKRKPQDCLAAFTQNHWIGLAILIGILASKELARVNLPSN